MCSGVTRGWSSLPTSSGGKRRHFNALTLQSGFQTACTAKHANLAAFFSMPMTMLFVFARGWTTTHTAWSDCLPHCILQSILEIRPQTLTCPRLMLRRRVKSWLDVKLFPFRPRVHRDKTCVLQGSESFATGKRHQPPCPLPPCWLLGRLRQLLTLSGREIWA